MRVMFGATALSEFKIAKLTQSVQAQLPSTLSISSQYIHLAECGDDDGAVDNKIPVTTIDKTTQKPLGLQMKSVDG